MRKTPKMRAVEAIHGPLEECIPEAVEQHDTLEKAGAHLGIPPATLNSWAGILGYQLQFRLVRYDEELIVRKRDDTT